MRRLTTTTTGLLVALMLTGVLPASMVLAAEDSTIELSGPTSVEVGQDVVLTATVTAPAGYEVDATIDFVESGGADGCTAVPVDTSGTTCTITGLAVGSYVYHATYSGNTDVNGSSSGDVAVEVTDVPPPDPSPSTTTLTGPGSIVVGTDATITATIDAPAGYDGDGATVDFTAIAGGGPSCLDIPVSTSGTDCDLGSGLAVGTYTYEASYSGNATTEASSGQVTFDVTAVPDTTLDATGVTVNYSKFYPAKDSYKDKLTIAGVRGEPISVTIRIYSPTGKRIKTVALALGTGAYSYLWSGRTSSGKIRAAGKYKIVQTLKDLAGNSLVVTKYSTLSHKKLVTRTKYVTKKGLSITAGSVGNIWISKSSGYAKLKGSSGNPSMAGYAFTIPSATRYKSISFQIYATGPKSAPRSEIGMQNFGWSGCTSLSGDWNIFCFDQEESWYGSSAKWHSTSGSPTNNRKGTKVRGVVFSSHGTVTVRKVRVKVVYQVLR